MIGQSIPRLEDHALLTGRAQFIDDLNLHGQLYAWFVRASQGHARIEQIDTQAAARMPGVFAVYTHADLNQPANRSDANDGGSTPIAIHEQVGLKNIDGSPARLPPRPLLAADRVRFVGDTVALVLASSPEAACAAAEQVSVAYEPLAVVTTAEAALQARAPQLFEDVPENTALHWQGGNRAAVESAFAAAAHVVELSVINNRVVIAPMEPRGVLASYDPGTGRYLVYAPSQGANEISIGIARALGISSAQVRVITPQVGGGFGIKIPAYPEYILAAWAARKSGRAVKWYADRTDGFITDGQGRDHVMHASLALSAEGDFLAIRCKTVSNCGAYGSPSACTIPTAGGTRCITGIYQIPAWHADVKVVYTNTVPVIAYRGAGKPEYNYLVERLVDAAARSTGHDPITLRRRNAVRSEQMPFTTGTGIVFDSGEFEKNLDDALAIADTAGFAARREISHRNQRLRGLGIAMFQEPDGFLDNRVNMVLGSNAELSVTVTGQDGGQGHVTTFAQVAAAQLGIGLDRIQIRQGDSDLIGPGRGSGGSRTATVASMGIVKGSAEIIAKARLIAAHAMETAAQDLEFENGAFRVIGTDRMMRIESVAANAYDISHLPDDMMPGLEATVHYQAREYNYPSGCNICELEIEPETGLVHLQRYVAVNDHGIAINPMLLEGQFHGGVVQGLGQAMTESCVYEADTAQLLSGSFMDYCLPRARDLPAIEMHRNVVPALTNALGVKGVGESGCTVGCPAVMNAAMDALAQTGVRRIDMPLTPERVWRAIQSAARHRP